MVGLEELSLIVKRLEIVTEKLEAVGEGGGGDGAGVSQAEKLNISVTAYDDIYNGTFKAFLGNHSVYKALKSVLSPVNCICRELQQGWRRCGHRGSTP